MQVLMCDVINGWLPAFMTLYISNKCAVSEYEVDVCVKIWPITFLTISHAIPVQNNGVELTEYLQCM